MTAKIAAQMDDTAAAAYPHIVFRDVLGAKAVAGLLDHVATRETEFRQTTVRNRESRQFRVDPSLRKSLSTNDLGEFRAPFETFVRTMVAPALARFRLAEAALVPKEFLIQAYRDGDRFRPHIDTNELLNRVRVLSCVYYFALTPRRFSGGELRIFGLPTLSVGRGAEPQFVDIVPETDTMIVFPSWLRHEVLPVRVPSGAWMDGRFTINCWLHRLSEAGVTPSPAP